VQTNRVPKKAEERAGLQPAEKRAPIFSMIFVEARSPAGLKPRPFLGLFQHPTKVSANLTTFSFMNIVRHYAITGFVLIQIVGPRKNRVLLSFVFNNITGPSFIFTPPMVGRSSGRFSELDGKAAPEIPVGCGQH